MAATELSHRLVVLIGFLPLPFNDPNHGSNDRLISAEKIQPRKKETCARESF
jgi:hypothetical protein